MDKHAIFQLTVKAVVQSKDRILLLQMSDNILDFPGGRLNESEVNISLEEVLKREIKEELGQDFKFEVQDLAFVTRRRYNKHDHDHMVIAVFFNVKYLGGPIILSAEHMKTEWILPSDLLDKKELFQTLDEYKHFAKYFGDK